MNEFKGWYKFPNENLESVKSQMERLKKNGAAVEYEVRQGAACPEARWTQFGSL